MAVALTLTPVQPTSLDPLHAGVLLESTAVDTQVLRVRGYSGQTADLLRLEDSAGTALLNVDNDGVLQLNNANGRAVTVGGTMDGNDADSGNRLRIAIGTAFQNGVNSTRGGSANSITDDTANGAGASFFADLYFNSTFATEGSLQNIWSQITVNEDAAGNDRYAEAMAFYGNITSNRRGALIEGVQMGLTLSAGKPGRASAGHFIVTENNPIADYATYLGASSLYATTGAIALQLTQSGGSEYVGTGLHIGGNFLSSIRIHNGDVTNYALKSKVSGDTVYAFQVSPRGTLEWGDGSGAVDVKLYRSAADVLQTDDSLTVSAIAGKGAFRSNQVQGDVVLSNKIVSSDSQNSFKIFGDGKHQWGVGGSSAPDVDLTRPVASVLALGADDSFRTGLAATGSRPSAATVGQGSQFYDTTLHKPIWSDGTNWRDAAGTVV